MPPKFETHALATRLIREAEVAALKSMQGAKADDRALRALARQIKQNILAQVLLGQWKALGVHEVDQLNPLVVIVGRGGIGRHPISIKYDFTRTVLASLLVDRRGRS